MEKSRITFEQLPEVVATILKEVRELKELHSKESESETVETSSKNPFDDYILRSEIVGTGKAISDATAWKWEKEGKIQAYGIGGKRYYKRADVEQLFTKVKK
ncbi:MAG: helix-turn-helix domain-containing protein [Brumimicrobium sp.]|nr:helix-turn-helix domain-containing protein [Brumimicrobium sp.]